MELHQLKNDINNLKCKEVNIIKQYVKVLNFLEDIKKTLGDIKGKLNLNKNSACDNYSLLAILCCVPYLLC